MITEIKPQPGPQEDFLSTSADIAVTGGAAGGGKSYGLIMEPTRHVDNEEFVGTLFRRTMPQIKKPGGLWDTAGKLYPLLKGRSIQNPHQYIFPHGSRIEFHHLQYESDLNDWQGAQLPFIGFDELTHFTEKMFWYMFSRLRSMSGIPGYIRGTTNPDPFSWVKRLIEWYLDSSGEYADPNKSGKIRYLVRSGDNIEWFSSERKAEKYAKEINTKHKSFTFIPSNLYDNKILLKEDPDYEANLMILPRVERARLLDGNWKIRAGAGDIFNKSDFEIVDRAPAVVDKTVRFWDRAASEPSQQYPDPDWTVGVKMSRLGSIFYITDVNRFRKGPGKVEQAIKNTTSQDGKKTTIGIFQDPGASGKSEAASFVRLLAGYAVKVLGESGKKYNRWLPLAAQAQHGNVKLVRGPWNDTFLTELENLSENEGEYDHDDQGDASAGCFELLTTGVTGKFGKQEQSNRTKPKMSGFKERKW